VPQSSGHPLDAPKLETGMMPGTSSARDAGGRQLVAEPEEGFGFKEELGDRAVGPGIELALQVVDIGLALALRGGFRDRRDRDFERRDLSAPRPVRPRWHSHRDAG
jgi:hypothetical protein